MKTLANSVLGISPWDALPEGTVYWVELHTALTNERSFSQRLVKIDDRGLIQWQNLFADEKINLHSWINLQSSLSNDEEWPRWFMACPNFALWRIRMWHLDKMVCRKPIVHFLSLVADL